MRLIFILFIFISSTTSADDNNLPLKIIQLTDNVYQHISYKKVEPWGMVAASGLIVVEGSNAHLIDTPWTKKATEQLIEWVASKDLVLKSSIVTHFHKDASGGISHLNQAQVNTYATPLTNKLLDMKNREKSNHEITSNTYEVISNTIEAFYPGPGHTQDNIVVWLPKEKMLFGGCMVKSINSKTLGNTADASVKDWPTSIRKIINKYPDIKIVVPGHGKVGDISLLKHTAQLALALKP